MTNETETTETTTKDFPHSDYLDMRDLLDDEDARPALIAAMIEDGLASDEDDVERYADDEPTLIAEYAFTNYAQELAEDIGAIDRDASWPLRHIDWEAAANELLYDYSSVTIEGHTYYVRAI